MGDFGPRVVAGRNFVVLEEWIGTKAPVLRLLDLKTRQFPSCPDRKVSSTRSGHLMVANIAAAKELSLDIFQREL